MPQRIDRHTQHVELYYLNNKRTSPVTILQYHNYVVLVKDDDAVFYQTPFPNQEKLREYDHLNSCLHC